MPFHGYQGRTQWVVYWPRVGTGPTGAPTVSDVAQELQLRFDQTVRNVLQSDGTVVTLDGTAGGWTFAPVVGSAVWKGRLDDLPGTSQLPDSDVYRIVKVDVVPDVRGRSSFREATLVRAGDFLFATENA